MREEKVIVLKKLSAPQYKEQTKTKTGEHSFGENVLKHKTLYSMLPQKIVKRTKELLKSNEKIPIEIADAIARCFKEWAISRGVTHYTHWFQPLTGQIAEKSDNFLDFCKLTKRKINTFEASHLVQQETDGSSFPNGGLRSTFEARGYILWDSNSCPFILNRMLYIPSMLVSNNNEALDFKTPLLRSIKFLEEIALKFIRLIRPETVSATSFLGWEQEFFLIDRSVLLSRPDLRFTGRMAVGNPPTLTQTQNSHYFGKIPLRILNFMDEIEEECFKLGIPLKTRHNEVASNQYEFCYFYSPTDISSDHNQLFIVLLEEVAQKHNLKVLIREKPFAAMNGSGKHCNFSICTEDGLNVFEYGENKRENLLFYSFLTATISAISKNGDILNESIVSFDNDKRIGGNEAPPGILSVFIGQQLYDWVFQKNSFECFSSVIPKDTADAAVNGSDRNRTSPFAYNKNRFEFRSVGSSTNCASPMVAINTIIGNELKLVYDEVISTTQTKEKGVEDVIFDVLKKNLSLCEKAVFNGDGYSQNWRNEAIQRGISGFKHCPDAIQKCMKNFGVYTRNGVFTEKEIMARLNIKLDKYIAKSKTEYKILKKLCIKAILPGAEKELVEAKQRKEHLKAVCGSYFGDFEKEEKIESSMRSILEGFKRAESLMGLVPKDNVENAVFWAEKILPVLGDIRKSCDDLETRLSEDNYHLLQTDDILYLG